MMCSNGCRRPVQPPSKVLCAVCLDRLDKELHALLGVPIAKVNDEPVGRNLGGRLSPTEEKGGGSGGEKA